jgi:hypothetical protein
MPMHPRPMTPTSGPLLPSVVVRMLCGLLAGAPLRDRAVGTPYCKGSPRAADE